LQPFAWTGTSFDTAAQPELLASASNPHGWRVDELIAQIRRELERQLLELDGRDEKTRQRLVGYQGVIAALWEAEGRYRVLGPHQSWPSR
jgi:hypothetical protein